MQAQEESAKAELEAKEKAAAEEAAKKKKEEEEAKAKKEAEKAAAEKAKAEKEAAEKAAAEKIKADKEAAEKAKKDSKLVKEAENLLEVMDRMNVDMLYKNSKGELFTSENLAHLSEGNEKKRVSSWQRSLLEAIVNTKKS